MSTERYALEQHAAPAVACAANVNVEIFLIKLPVSVKQRGRAFVVCGIMFSVL